MSQVSALLSVPTPTLFLTSIDCHPDCSSFGFLTNAPRPPPHSSRPTVTFLTRTLQQFPFTAQEKSILLSRDRPWSGLGSLPAPPLALSPARAAGTCEHTTQVLSTAPLPGAPLSLVAPAHRCRLPLTTFSDLSPLPQINSTSPVFP